MNGLTSEQVSELHGDLVVLGGELDALLEMSEEIAKPIELEQPIGRLSRMDAMQQREMAMANRAAHERRRALVAEALEAFDDGSYGACVTCEGSIPFARLKALPETPVCLSCQERRE